MRYLAKVLKSCLKVVADKIFRKIKFSGKKFTDK